jgi:guanylate kinase
VGKSSVVSGLAERLPFHFSVSMTTRPARPGEVDGVAYWFVDRDRFERARAGGELVEWAEYSGYLYGTPFASIEEPLARGEDVLLDIEMVGSEQVRAAFPEAVMVFVDPPGMDVLEERLRGRGDTTDVDMAKRLGVAKWQMERAREIFDHFVVNDDLARVVDEVVGILSLPRPPLDPS